MKRLLEFCLILLLLQAVAGHAAPTVTKIAPGSNARDGLFLKSDGSLWAMGWNIFGGLGDGTANTATRPEQIIASNVTALATGSAFNLFLKSDGSLWAMGENDFGELGDGTFSTNNGVKVPEQIVPSGVTAIAAGYYHSLFIKSDGSLWAMGRNDHGQLGDGTFGNPASNNSTNRPEQIVPSGVTAIAAGRGHSLFLKSDGSLWGMGWNIAGQLGDGTYNDNNRPEQIVSSNVTAIAAGFGHSLFLKSNGGLRAMGYNSSGQLGDSTYDSTNQPQHVVDGGVTAIAAGEGSSSFVKSDGSLWVMGDNTYGQLGDGFATNGITVPEQIVPSSQLVLSIALSSRTNVQIDATCEIGGNFVLLGSTNLVLPLSQWTPLRTNSVTLRGNNNYSVVLTNVVTAGGRQFYSLQLP